MRTHGTAHARASAVLPDDLLCPEAWPEPRPARVELIQTHLSWVFRGDQEVIKVKKPVDLGFVDFRSIRARRLACANETRLNARLAPDAYLGVLPVVATADGTLKLGAANRGRVVDWAVRMVRLDDGSRADSMLARGGLCGRHVDAVADAMAALHAGAIAAPAAARRFASRAAVERNVRENFEQSRVLAHELVGAAAVGEVEQQQLGFLRDHAEAFARRISIGRVRDGHGDLRLEHAYFVDDGLRIIDCLEFSDRYRIADVAADVAFFSMDLAGSGRRDLAERFLARYAQAADDYDLYEMVDFYEGYRAWVRGKVEAMLSHDAGASGEVRERAANEARRHFTLAQACERPVLVAPVLVCVGGMVASGKSTVASALGEELSCPVLSSDRVRKRLRGVDESERLGTAPWEGAYSEAATTGVYEELFRRASTVLASGRSVIVDASFRTRLMRRRAFETARACGVSPVFVECRAPLDECRRRLAQRAPGASDASAAMFDEFAARFEPVVEIPASEHVVVDTTRPPGQSMQVLRERIAAWPKGLVA
jgi:aminoglycoside phosphotransferase family enzyme/predicted kinase